MLTLPRRRMCSMQNYEFINSDAKHLCFYISVCFAHSTKLFISTIFYSAGAYFASSFLKFY